LTLSSAGIRCRNHGKRASVPVALDAEIRNAEHGTQRKTTDDFGHQAVRAIANSGPLRFPPYPEFIGGLTMMQPKNIVKQAKQEAKQEPVPTCALGSYFMIVPGNPIQETRS
jgi:hypothetical protein